MRKIDIFANGKYLCSTNQSRTCKEAISRIKDLKVVDIAGAGSYNTRNDKITAYFAR